MRPDKISFPGFFASYAKRFGLNRTLKSLGRQIKVGNLIDDYFVIKGICDGRLAFKGPLSVQIDLTDSCNNDCICCWCNSPLLKKTEKVKNPSYLDRSLVLSTIDELRDMGVRDIAISGGGEPFCYPYLKDVIRHIKNRKIRCQLYTNFTLATKQSIKELVDLKLDCLIVSLWAGTSKTYSLLHPNKEEGCFDAVKSKLIYLADIKKRRKIPIVRIHNVINALNYNEFSQMEDFAIDTKSDEISFCVMDSVSSMTDSMLLNNEQRQEVIDNYGKLTGKVPVYGSEEFIRRISYKGAVSGNYDEGVIDQTPCYSGWLFARIKADGSVNPCLKSHRLPVGNINNQSFKEIWNSPLQQEFRNNAKTLPKSDLYFSSMGNGSPGFPGCSRICDDLTRNIMMYRKTVLFPTTRLVAMVVRLENKFENFNKKVIRLSKISYLAAVVLTYTLLLKLMRSIKKISVFPGE